MSEIGKIMLFGLFEAQNPFFVLLWGSNRLLISACL